MQTSIPVGLSAQLALLRRIDSIANNVANQSTPGYRAEEITFASLLGATGSEPTTFTTRGDSHISKRTGDILHTGNNLDVAVAGEAWLGLSTPAGLVYTRDGRMQMSPAGQLQSVNGYPIVDVGGSPLQLDPTLGDATISNTGAITQAGRPVGGIGLFVLPRDAVLSRFEGASVRSNLPAISETDPNRVGVKQGYVERSNVNAMTEMARLITLHRSFDATSNMLGQIEGTLTEAIKTLGGG